MPSCQKRESIRHVLDATRQARIANKILLGHQTKRGTTMGVIAMSLLCSLLAVLMIAVVSASDEAALLAFKAQLSNGGSLASWNSSTNFCSWEGVACSHRRPARVVALSLEWQRPRRSTLPGPWESHVPAEARPQLQLAPRGDSREPRSPPPPAETLLV